MLDQKNLQPFLRMGVGLGLLVVFFSCANSPQEDLVQTQARLASIERSEAVSYVPDELGAVRNYLHHAENQLRANRFVSADKEIKLAASLLDSAVLRYEVKKQAAAVHGERFLSYVDRQLDSLRVVMKDLPINTYAEQNIADIVRSRHRDLQKQLHILKENLQAQEYLAVLKQEQTIRSGLLSLNSVLGDRTDKRYQIRTVSTSGFVKGD